MKIVRLEVVVLAMFLGACAAPPPVTDLTPGPLAGPPETRIHGVAGKPRSWCGSGGCADGFVNDAAFLPAATPPYTVEIPDGALIAGASAYLPRTPTAQDVTQLEVDGTGLVGVPDDAEWICVGLQWPPDAEWRDATYCWATTDGAA